MEINIDAKTKFLLSVAMFCDKYSKYMDENYKVYADILGYVFRVHQDKLVNVSPQGIALMLVYLKGKRKTSYSKYLDLYKDKVDNIISSSKSIEEQFEKMDKLR